MLTEGSHFKCHGIVCIVKGTVESKMEVKKVKCKVKGQSETETLSKNSAFFYMFKILRYKYLYM
jgi:hypothetical protein